MPFYRGGVKQVDGGTALAMESFAPTIKRVLYGQSKQRLSAPLLPSNSNAMKQRASGLLELSK